MSPRRFVSLQMLSGGIALAAILLTMAPAPAHAALERVGTTALADQRVTGQPPQTDTRDLYVGDDVFFQERVQTSDNGRAQVLFVDESSVTLGPGSDLMIDKFVYDPETSSGETVMSLGSGVMRFIGGQISRNEGVEISTPTATIGIRGSIAQIRSSPSGTTIDILKSNVVQITGPQGETITITEAGVRVTVSADGGSEVEKLTSDDAAGLTTDFADPDGPDEVQESLGEEIDRRSEDELGGDDSTLQSDPLYSSDDPLSDNKGSGFQEDSSPEDETRATEQIQDRGTESLRGKAVTPLQQTLNGIDAGRLLLTGGSFTGAYGTFIGDALEDNYLGGPKNFIGLTGVDIDLALGTATFSDGTESGTLPIASGGVSLRNYNLEDASTVGADPPDRVDGFGFLDPRGIFLYYDLKSVANPNDRAFLFAGVPTPGGGNMASDLRVDSYSIIPDNRWDSPVPGLDDTILSNFPNANVSDVLVLRRQNGKIASVDGQSRSRFLFGAIDIVGQGADQKSLFHVSEDALTKTSSGKLALSAGSRGSMRLGADQQPIRIFADYNAIPDANGDAFFGPQLDYFVLGPQGPAERSPDDKVEFGTNGYVPYGNSSLSGPDIDRDGFESFGSTEVAVRTGQRNDLTRNRSARTLNGFAAGLAESRTGQNGDYTFPAPYALVAETTSDNLSLPGNVRIATQPGTNSVRAIFDMSDEDDGSMFIDTARLAFGGLNGEARGSYVNDDVWAARNSQTVRGDFNGEDGRATPFNPFGFRSAIATSGLANDTDVLPSGVSFCDCKFLEWGYWTSRFEFGPDSSAPGRQEYVHLATWVAGELPDFAEIPQSGTARYTGHAIANVYNNGNQYLAAGNFENEWDFGDRTGNVTISNLDGQTFIGSVNANQTQSNTRDYSGLISSEVASGLIQGTFFKGGGDPVAETGGQFSVSGSNYQAVGTFAGAK